MGSVKCLKETGFYGDDQMVICDQDGNVLSDKTGFMGGDAPMILAYIQERAILFHTSKKE